MRRKSFAKAVESVDFRIEITVAELQKLRIEYENNDVIHALRELTTDCQDQLLWWF